MAILHIEHSGKSTRVQVFGLQNQNPKPTVVNATSRGVVSNTRLLTGINPRPGALSSETIKAGDPELDLNNAGMIVAPGSFSNAYFDPAEQTEGAPLKAVGDFSDVDIVFDAEGKEKSRRPHLRRMPNLNEAMPLKLGKRLPAAEVFGQFVIKTSLQLAHQDSLSFEFLRDLAADLHKAGEVVMVGGGARGQLPLVIREGGSPFRAFLYGEVDSEQRYKLLLLLSDQELKLPAVPEAKA
jgi:hypothetical protein